MEPLRSYLICGTPRSGTSLLCEGLKSTGIAGRPEEYFWRDDEPFWREQWGVERYADYLAAAKEQGTTPNGVFGAKVMWGYLDDVFAKLRTLLGKESLSAHEVLASTFPNLQYIAIRRRDRTRQAISWLRASQTGIWVDRGEASLPIREPSFDPIAILNMAAMIADHDERWNSFFVETGVSPLEIEYGGLVDAFEETIRAVLTYLEVAAPPDLLIPPPSLRRQADAVTEEWVRRYQAWKSSSKH